MKIKKILIANRGEIAVRIIKAAKEMGITSLVVYAPGDRLAMHVQQADEAYPIFNRSVEPYLDIDQIIGIAKKSGADAVHPGYGFLSENALFARYVTQSGIVFIGPSHEAIAMMGDKLQAKATARAAGVPVIPGFEVHNVNDAHINKQAANIGYPVLIKARAGGGGKGMRLVMGEDHLKDQIMQAMSEAKAAFGDGGIFIEKYIERPRHIEIQVLADKHGNAVHLFERECSIQRRHQKVIEEAPSSALDEALRVRMGEAALKLVKACAYTNAGTLEFILDENKNFYFLEMNTRLQVEHPVTEFITGLDLVKEQIKIAEGKKLSYSQQDLRILGHAIELRVCAEDPGNSFFPDTGKLIKYIQPAGIGIRVDGGYKQGMEIPMEYDPLLAKLIVFAPSRKEAIERMKYAIDDFEIEGVKNTLGFGRYVMDNQQFCTGNFDTGFISRETENFNKLPDNSTNALIAALTAFIYDEQKVKKKIKQQKSARDPWWESRK